MRENIQVKEDCINYEKQHKYCRGLKQLFCADSKWCPFYKSEKIYDSEGRMKGEMRHELGRQGA
jgi:hypothetical protein